MNLSNAETGCWIDGSHRSSFDFMCLVIEMAHDYGFEMDWEQYAKDIEAYNTDSIFEDYAEMMDALDWTYEDALGYLNDNTREGLYWEVVDQSLYLVEDADASQ